MKHLLSLILIMPSLALGQVSIVGSNGVYVYPIVAADGATNTFHDSQTNATFTITRANYGASPCSVVVSTVDGSAVAGVDYTSTTSTVTFANGVMTKTFTVPLIKTGIASTNAFTISAATPIQCVLGSTTTSTCSLVHDIALPLDGYTNIAAAYSVRRLLTSYSGSLLRVRRSSDQAEQDIGYDGNGNLDTTALASFCAATDGFVTKWYDQSGNTKDAVQPSAAGQLKIVNSGTVLTIGSNNRPALVVSASGQVMNVGTSSISQPNTIHAVVKLAQANINGNKVFMSSNQYVGADLNGGTGEWYIYDTTKGYALSGVAADLLAHAMTSDWNGTLNLYRDNSNIQTQAVAGTGTFASGQIGDPGSVNSGIRISEMVVFTSLLDPSKRGTLVTNEKTHFGF